MYHPSLEIGCLLLLRVPGANASNLIVDDIAAIALHQFGLAEAEGDSWFAGFQRGGAKLAVDGGWSWQRVLTCWQALQQFWD